MRKCYKKGLGRGEGSCGVGVMCQEYEEKKRYYRDWAEEKVVAEQVVKEMRIDIKQIWWRMEKQQWI